MWKFVTASDSDKHPLLHSLNANVGRQVWAWDPNAGTPEERARVEELRAKFAENRLTQKHSADELLRLQSEGRRKAGPFPVDAAGLPPTAAPPADTVAAALRNGMSFYESLQADDGHWPGDYGGPMFLMPGMVITLYTTGVLDNVLSTAPRWCATCATTRTPTAGTGCTSRGAPPCLAPRSATSRCACWGWDRTTQGWKARARGCTRAAAHTTSPPGASSGWRCWASTRGRASTPCRQRCGCCPTLAGPASAGRTRGASAFATSAGTAMKFELSEDTLLKVSGVGALAYGAASIVAPREFHKVFMSKATAPADEVWRFHGLTASLVGADHLLLSCGDGYTQKQKKDMLKIAGLGWLTAAALNAYNCQNGTQPKEVATANVVGQSLLASACLWKGFQE